MLKLRSRGRGRHYSVGRALVESALSYAFAGNWPARVWARVPGATTVQQINHELAVLPPGAAPIRIGFISDIHIGPTTPPATIEAGFELLRKAAPDVLLLGGDYVFQDVNTRKARTLAKHVDSVPARTKLAVLGNHDLWDRHELIEDELRKSGVGVLVNESVTLPPPFDHVTVVGLDDPWTGTPDPQRAFSSCPDHTTRVVLCHAPEVLPLVCDRDVAVVMCGHTHGGQISTPSRPLFVHGHVGKKHWAGLHQRDGTTLCVSRGIGGIEVPMRLFADPDVVVLTLSARRDAQ